MATCFDTQHLARMKQAQMQQQVEHYSSQQANALASSALYGQSLGRFEPGGVVHVEAAQLREDVSKYRPTSAPPPRSFRNMRLPEIMERLHEMRPGDVVTIDRHELHGKHFEDYMRGTDFDVHLSMERQQFVIRRRLPEGGKPLGTFIKHAVKLRDTVFDWQVPDPVLKLQKEVDDWLKGTMSWMLK